MMSRSMQRDRHHRAKSREDCWERERWTKKGSSRQVLSRQTAEGSRARVHYQSTGREWPDWETSSGARYSGVPQRVKVFTPGDRRLANPKSAIFK